MIQTFLDNWPNNVTLVVYAEDCHVAESAPNLLVCNLSEVEELTNGGEYPKPMAMLARIL
jgi:hypothetical protein